MVKEIWRLSSFGIGIESVAGTPVSATHWIPTDSFTMKPIVEKSTNDNAFGIIDEIGGSAIAKETSEISAGGIVRSESFGTLLKLALGTEAVPTLLETSVYSHAFTRLNSNAHPSATIVDNNGTQDMQAPYCMLESLEIDATVGEYVKFTTTFKGGKIATTSATPSFLTGTTDEAFIAGKVTVKYATDIAGLSAWTAISLQNIKLSISKNTLQIFKLGSTTIDANVNQQFGVTGDFEAVYDATTIRDFFTANTKKAIQIEIEGATLIGATKYNKLTIQLASVQLESWEKSTGNNDIVNETIGMIAEYSFTDTQTINAILVNKKSAVY